MPLQIDQDRFGSDVRLPQSPDESPAITASGDLPTITGRPNLAEALRRRLVTNPGELVHRPDYGCGLAQFVEVELTPSQRARMAAVARKGLLRDSRVSEVEVSVSLGIPGATTVRAATVTIEVSYRAADDDEAGQFTVSYEQG